MIRLIIENVLLFLLPTLMYLGYMYLVRSDKDKPANLLDDAPLIWLFAAGTLLVVIVLVVFGNVSGGQPGQPYQPPVFRDGKIQPGYSE